MRQYDDRQKVRESLAQVSVMRSGGVSLHLTLTEDILSEFGLEVQ